MNPLGLRFSPGNFLDLRAENRVFAQMGGYTISIESIARDVRGGESVTCGKESRHDCRDGAHGPSGHPARYGAGGPYQRYSFACSLRS